MSDVRKVIAGLFYVVGVILTIWFAAQLIGNEITLISVGWQLVGIASLLAASYADRLGR